MKAGRAWSWLARLHAYVTLTQLSSYRLKILITTKQNNESRYNNACLTENQWLITQAESQCVTEHALQENRAMNISLLRPELFHVMHF